MAITSMIKGRYMVDIELETLMQNPSLQQLAKILEEKQRIDTSATFY